MKIRHPFLRTFGLIQLCTLSIFCHADVFTGSGSSHIPNGDTVVARELAVEDAKKQLLGGLIENFLALRINAKYIDFISNDIITELSAELVDFKLLSVAKDNHDSSKSNDVYRVSIAAELNIKQLAVTLQNKLLEKRYSWYYRKPGVFIALDGSSTAPPFLVEMLRNAIKERFMRDGFEILDSPSENPRSTGFQVMGIIHLSEQNLDVIGVSINSKELSGSLVLQRMGSSEILSKQPFNSSFRGAGGKRMYTGEINGILNDIYPIISEKLSDIWAQRLGNKESVIVEIHGANIGNKLSMISRTFDKMLFGVQTVSHTSSGSNHAVFTVGYLGWPEQFLEELNLLLAINKVLNISIEGFDKDQLKLIAN